MTGPCEKHRLRTNAGRVALAWAAVLCAVLAIVAVAPMDGPDGHDDATVVQAVARVATIGHATVPSLAPDALRVRRGHGVVLGGLLFVLAAAGVAAASRPATTLVVRSCARPGAARSRPGASRAPPHAVC